MYFSEFCESLQQIIKLKEGVVRTCDLDPLGQSDNLGLATSILSGGWQAGVAALLN